MRLFAERIVITRAVDLGTECDEVLAPLMTLSFDYGGTRVRASDDDDHEDRLFKADRNGLAPVSRARGYEIAMRRELERAGAVELACVDDDVATPPGCEADYAVRLGADAHAFCAFTADVLPKLRASGWEIDVAPDYPFQIAVHDPRFSAVVEPDDEKPDWFSLELGVVVDGTQVSLLPMILDIIEHADGESGLQALTARSRPTYALRVTETHNVTLSAARLVALVRVVIELYDARTKALIFPGTRAPSLARLDDALRNGGGGGAEGKSIAWRDRAGVVERGRTLASKPLRVEAVEGLCATLRPYQEDGVAFLQHLRDQGEGGVLADDMGLGKTLQTIAHICVEKASGRMTAPVLVVAPTSLVCNWAKELAKFAPHLNVLVLHGSARSTRFPLISQNDVVITTYPLISRDEERFAEQTFHLIVLDEAQAIKNARSQAHRGVKAIHAEHRICLSGTPVENNLGELWSIFEFLTPGLLGDELAFRRAYRQPIEQHGDEMRLAALRDQVAPRILRREKRDVAKDLPPKTEMGLPIELTGAQRELYEQIRVAAHADVRKAIRSKGLAASTLPILGALMKLRQVCCDPRLVAMDAARDVRESAKFDALMALLTRELKAGHRALVFSQFTSMLALIGEGLAARGVKHLSLTGETRDRGKVVDAYEDGKADVFLISLKAGGTGLNLTSADTVVHYDPWWNPAAQAQATDRAYRIGQTRPVFVHNLFVAGSVEERVIKLQQRKRWLSNALLSGDPQGAGVQEEDVDALLAPLDDGGEE